MDELVGHPSGDVVIVVVGHADEHAQTGSDAGDLLTGDDDGRLRHPLHDGPHRPIMAAPARSSGMMRRCGRPKSVPSCRPSCRWTQPDAES